MKKRNLLLLAVGIVPLILGRVMVYSAFLMMAAPWIWLLICFFASDRKEKVIKQWLLLLGAGIILIAAYLCYRVFLMDIVSVFSPLNGWPQHYLSTCVLMASRLYALIYEPETLTSEAMLAISAGLTCIITFVGVFIKTRFKNVERDF